MAEVKG